MPVGIAPTLTRALEVPDPLDSGAHRQFLVFPFLPSGGDSDLFTMLAVNVQVPPPRIGHVRVSIYNQVRGFRGHRDHGNLFNVSFYEVTGGPVTFAMLAWLELCTSSYDDSGLEKYMVDLDFFALDTTGEVAYRFRFGNVWPQQVTPSPSSEQSAPTRVEVTFNVDFLDLVAGGSLPPDMKGFMRDSAWRGSAEIPASSLMSLQSSVGYPASSEQAWSTMKQLISTTA